MKVLGKIIKLSLENGTFVKIVFFMKNDFHTFVDADENLKVI